MNGTRLAKIMSVVVVLLLPLVLPFQNCGDMGGSFESSSYDAWDTVIVELRDPMGEDHGAEKLTETLYETPLVDRFYFRSLILAVFGPSAVSVETSQIDKKGEEWGGPCSLYVDHKKTNESGGGLVVASAIEACGIGVGNFLGAKSNPDATLLRQALLARACSDLTTNNATLQFALNQLGSSAVPALNDQTVGGLLRLFYRGHVEPDQSVHQALMAMFPAQGVTREHWRSALYTVCASGYWQVN